MFARRPALLLTALLAMVSCSSQNARDTSPISNQPDVNKVITQLEPITCTTKAAAKFYEGLTLAYGFNYDAAVTTFRSAIDLDPNCAMGWWGIALASGPHINFPLVPPDKGKIAYEAVQKAKSLAQRASALEQSLIQALEKRYVERHSDDRSALDRSYAEAMKSVWQSYPAISDVGALYAESLMDLHPWDLWKTNGEIQPWTPEILMVLDQTLKVNPDHPHANHLYIHAVEASNDPGKAVPSADRLQTLVPSSGHLLHMPAHIYARVGRWDDAANANLRSMAADVESLKRFPRPGFYAVYMTHSKHFLAFGRMMQGRSSDAISAGREMVASIPDDFLKEFGPIADGFLVFTSEALMRFGKWDEVLREPAPRGNQPFSKAMWHFTRAVAFNALDRVSETAAERKRMLSAIKAIPATSTFGNNSSRDLMAVAVLVLDGEIAGRRGEYSKAIDLLKKASAKEDELRYDEPPDWIQPVRHALGAVLLKAKRYAEAEQAYREDLAKFPENGWSLYGLSEALRLQGKNEAKEVRDRFERAWAGADTPMKASCLCQQ